MALPLPPRACFVPQPVLWWPLSRMRGVRCLLPPPEHPIAALWCREGCPVTWLPGLSPVWGFRRGAGMWPDALPGVEGARLHRPRGDAV